MGASASVDAGDFDDWLESALTAWRLGGDLDVPCGDCRGCCSAGRFIPIHLDERTSLRAIQRQLLVDAAVAGDRVKVMGYRATGECPQLKQGACSIYQARPRTCKQFDCRVLAAAGLEIEGRWSERINARVLAWRFSFRTATSRERFHAVRRAARFIATHASQFPGGRVPQDAGALAILAIKVHSAFLGDKAHRSPSSLAAEVVTLSRLEAHAG